MTRWKIATAVTMAATGVVIGTAASAQSPAPTVTTLDRDEFVQRFDCVAAPQPGQWSEATALLTKRRAIKTSVWMITGDETALIRAGVNKATASVITDVADLRLVCRNRVPFRTRVRWS